MCRDRRRCADRIQPRSDIKRVSRVKYELLGASLDSNSKVVDVPRRVSHLEPRRFRRDRGKVGRLGSLLVRENPLQGSVVASLLSRVIYKRARFDFHSASTFDVLGRSTSRVSILDPVYREIAGE